MARRRPASCRTAARAKAAGGAGRAASWRWKRCLTKASSPPPPATASSGSMTCPNASFPRTSSTSRRHLSAEAIRQLLELSAIAHGVGTEFDLRDYFRLPIAETKTALAELVEDEDAHPGRRRGLETAGLSAQGCEASAKSRRHRPALALRSHRLGAGAGRAAVRFPLPDRNLHARAKAQIRLLRAALPA